MGNYNEFCDRTKDYMKAVEAKIKQKYGKINDEWYGYLYMLASLYDTFLVAKEEVKKNGLVIQAQKGFQVSPYQKVVNDTSVQINKLATQMGLTPASDSKIEVKEKDVDVTEAIKSLMS